MEHETPEYIDRAGLLERLAEESATLPPRESDWWQSHRVEPFPARFAGRWHYVVASDGERVIFFADDEDEFGTGRLTSGNVLDEYGLFGDLIDAIRGLLPRPA